MSEWWDKKYRKELIRSLKEEVYIDKEEVEYKPYKVPLEHKLHNWYVDYIDSEEANNICKCCKCYVIGEGETIGHCTLTQDLEIYNALQ